MRYCPECGGDGEVSCFECNGDGKLTCQTCEGLGYLGLTRKDYDDTVASDKKKLQAWLGA